MKKILLAIIIFSLLLSAFVVVNAQGNTGKAASDSISKPVGSVGDTKSAEIDPYPDRNRIMPKEEADLVRQFVGYWKDGGFYQGFSFAEIGDVIVFSQFLYGTDAVSRGRVICAEKLENGNIKFTVYVPEALVYNEHDEYQYDVIIDVSERETRGGVYIEDVFYGYIGNAEQMEDYYNKHF